MRRLSPKSLTQHLLRRHIAVALNVALLVLGQSSLTARNCSATLKCTQTGVGVIIVVAVVVLIFGTGVVYDGAAGGRSGVAVRRTVGARAFLLRPFRGAARLRGRIASTVAACREGGDAAAAALVLAAVRGHGAEAELRNGV